MKMYLLSDNNDTLTGMRLAGIEGELVREKEEFYTAFEKALQRKDVAILLLTEKLSTRYEEPVNEAKTAKRLPLIITIPDRHGMGRQKDFITSYVQNAIGIKL